ncbi:SLC13 family permease [Curvivirga aplysinae]|uniref:SLC13 family permease n=1 Tax=Curvivirga aplysinae TaxID=2529852 RepID=UPI0012BCE048|nr:SLC13 family permease [Curvivirga aplysinae]MTI10428.1 SLC13 family permease [Curvivirga aplysinae]
MLGFDIASIQMISVFLIIAGTLYLYATDKLPLEVTSFAVICVLLVLFYVIPVPDGVGGNKLNAKNLLSGFANPALLTVLALLVLGEGLARTGVLDGVAVMVHSVSKGRPALSIVVALLVVVVISALLNNIPVVVIFVPIMQALAIKIGKSSSRYMMSLSFAAILGGMTTLIGSSTNLLVSSALIKLGEEGFSFFSFTVPGLVVAGAGLIYVLFVMPRILPDRDGYDSNGNNAASAGGKHFQAQIKVGEGSKLAGVKSVSGFFPDLEGVNVLTLMRGEEKLLPPYDDVTITEGDILIVSAARDKLGDFISLEPELLLPDLANAAAYRKEEIASAWRKGEQVLTECMVKPNSSYVGKSLKQIGFRYRNHATVIGVERRSNMRRDRVTETPLEAGDVLLIQGGREEIDKLRTSKDIILMEWSESDVTRPHNAKRAIGIFFAVVGCAGFGILPTEVAALSGAALMILFGALTLEQAVKSLDLQIILLIAAALALGVSMEATGGAAFMSHLLVVALGDAAPSIVLSGFFLLVACLANMLSTKATAVLFTPIAVSIAHEIGVPAEAFAVAVVFAANCSFASPVGYQTNLLVMAPGHYKFIDFIKYGSPLILICWAAFSLFAPFWYGL